MNKFTNSFYFNGNTYYYCDLKKLFEKYPLLRKLPNSLKILLEANVRKAKDSDIKSIIETFIQKNYFKQIEYYPTRVIMNDKFGLFLMMELALLRDKYDTKLNPKIMTDLIVENNNSNPQRNKERYSFLKWATRNIKNFSVIPPNEENHSLINIEYLSTMLCLENEDDKIFLYPETIIGTDSHARIINSLGVMGLNLSQIDTQAVMFGSLINLDFPKVVGVEVLGNLTQGLNFEDLILSLKKILKEHKIKDKFVEFYGNGLKNITLENRAILSNLVFEFGALCGYFGVDENTISYVEQTRGVDASIIKEYFVKQGMYENDDLVYDEYIRFNLNIIEPVAYYSKKANEKILIKEIPNNLVSFKKGNLIKDNDVVLSVVSSSKNLTSTIQACLVAKKACDLGLKINKNIKRYFEIDSFRIKDYLEKLDLLKYLEALDFEIVLKSPNEISQKIVSDIKKHNLDVVALSSNRNFEENINPDIKSNWYISSALVIAYSLKGTMNFDITKDAIYKDICLNDIFPSIAEVKEYLAKINGSLFEDVYKDITKGDKLWQYLKYENSPFYSFDKNSTYIKPYDILEDKYKERINIENAKIIAILGDNISNEYIVPSGKIQPYSQIGFYLESKGIKTSEFGTYEERYENSEFMKKAIFSSDKIKNYITNPKDGAYTRDFKTNEILSFYEFSENMKKQKTPLVLIAGKNFGRGQNELWAVKGIKLLGIKAVIAKSFEKTFKDNLLKVGVLPLEFVDEDAESLALDGNEIITILSNEFKINSKIEIEIRNDYFVKHVLVNVKFDTKEEINYYKNTGVLDYLINKFNN